ncbi:putative pore-forming cytolysin [Heterobasidion irregulare TC 32-1]|uniref:Putative pore-forming cytolysin n=1 Tax=Heterobasidion irregulare (strain TC 32-1) TaxID=747525 RepID=W4JS10_HETIT|nr:putative pore-forming cytolysin [Heterobasidion irregulare TC 32-1]ETW76318.1 putative pore-forming cytolysin [Heterobasidion irregulare TC 32-1]
MSTKTTFEDLAKLGWYKQQIFGRANAKRGGTMGSADHLHLNDSFADKWSWHCYNTTFGDLHKIGERPQTAKDDTVVWSYDNSNSDLPFPHTHRETYEETTTVTATISKSAEVKISQSFTIEAIASSSLDITIKADSTNTTTKEEKRSHEESWNITIPPGYKLELIRTRTDFSSTAEYEIDVGINGLIGTQGELYNEHYFWAYDINRLLGSPRGSLRIRGTSRKTSYTFTQKTESPKGEIHLYTLGIQEDGDQPRALILAASE